MDRHGQVESFIRAAQENVHIKDKLADCAVEMWGSSHLPLDIDIAKAKAVASEYGFNLSASDIVGSQCSKLAEFWQFEMENAFAARRSLSAIQCRVSAEVSGIYGYYR